MKKIVITIGLLLCSFSLIQGNTKTKVTLAKCVDGDTTHFNIGNEVVKVRYLAIDAPEYTKTKEPYGKEASEYVCNALKEAKTIELEYDDGSDQVDKYGRTLAWVFVDGKLLQKDLVEQGLAEVKYLYGDYAYTEDLKAAEKQAKAKKLNMWGDSEPEDGVNPTYFAGTIAGVVLILAGVFVAKGKRNKKKMISQGIKTVKKSRKR